MSSSRVHQLVAEADLDAFDTAVGALRVHIVDQWGDNALQGIGL
ncbi:hypothetical protein OH799_03900 [Nocardia sp. NBC_00881]|nr:hypothetical protein OH799_03900 [Nocardia sp. NBC_00881]